MRFSIIWISWIQEQDLTVDDFDNWAIVREAGRYRSPSDLFVFLFIARYIYAFKMYYLITALPWPSHINCLTSVLNLEKGFINTLLDTLCLGVKYSDMSKQHCTCAVTFSGI